MKQKFKTHVCYESVNYQINSKKGKITCHLNVSIPVQNLPGMEYAMINTPVVDQIFNQISCNKFAKRNDCHVYWHTCEECNEDIIDCINVDIYTIATCGANDTFDEELGKQIALTRAQKQSFIIAKIVYKAVAKVYYHNFIKYYEFLAHNCQGAIINAKEHIKELSGRN